MAKEKEAKTNVMRILDRERIPYRHYSYEHDGGAVDGESVAAMLGQNPAQVFKTLVTRGGNSFFVFVIPVGCELDLKAAARAVGEKSVSMLHVNELLPVTGYVRGGCSPIGMKKQFPTVVDESCLAFETMIFSGGKIGAQVDLEGARFARIPFLWARYGFGSVTGYDAALDDPRELPSLLDFTH